MKVKGFIIIIFLIVIFITLFPSIVSIKNSFEYDPDEGINSMKSLLFMKGFSLYKQIWSDQPPLFTLILSFWFRILGPYLYSGRILILIFSIILLWAFYQIIKIQSGYLCALVAVLFLILSALYVRLSISIMIGIPALMFAMLSIYFLVVCKNHYTKKNLLLSGLCMALSIHVKLFTFFLAPLILLELIFGGMLSEKKEKLFYQTVTWWLIGFFTIYISIIVVFFNFNFSEALQQLLIVHITNLFFDNPKYSFRVLLEMVLQDYDITILALCGMILFIRKRQHQYIFPILWLSIVSIILFRHRPIWWHYYPLLSIPICWIASLAPGNVSMQNEKRRPNDRIDLFLKYITIGSIGLTIILLPCKFERIYASLQEGAITFRQSTVLNFILKYKDKTRWIVTDKPIFAFYVNKLVPPQLAAFSRKRVLAQNLSPYYLISIMEKYNPEQILFSRFEYDDRIKSYIENKYIKIFQGKMLESRPSGNYNQIYNLFWICKPIFPDNYRPLGVFSEPDTILYLRKDILDNQEY